MADTYADHLTAAEPELALELAMIDHFVGQLAEPRQVLDAGCGAGRMMPYLASRGCVVEGIDLAPRMVERARHDHPEFPVQVASLASLPFPDETFDGVLGWHSTIHSADDAVRLFLAEAHRVLKPGGLVLLGFQTGDGVRDVADGYRKRGHDVVLMRYSRRLAWMTEELTVAALEPVARLERSASEGELDGQGFVLAHKRPDM